MIKRLLSKIDRVVFKGRLKRFYIKIKSKKKKNETTFSFFKGKESVTLKEPIYDLILMQYNNMDYSAYAFYDLAVRTLALEEYYGKNTIGYDYYKKMHTIGGNYGQENLTEKYYEKMRKENKTPQFGAVIEQHSIEQFSELIQSVDSNGFDENTVVMADRNLVSMNGAHRIAVALYNDLEFIKVDVRNMIHKRRFTRDWFWLNNFTNEEICVLDEKINGIFTKCKEKIGSYYCILFPPAEEYFDDITNDISMIDPGNVVLEKYEDFEWEIADLKGFLRGVYFFDSINIENFKRKLYYIFRASNPIEGKVKFRVLSIKINNPKYRLKNDNGMPESLVTVRLKSIIRKRYREKDSKFTEHYVGDYAHDVIIHSSDNYISNKAFRALLSMPKDMTSVFSEMKAFDYAIAESTHDKISCEFPRNYFFFEDFDILVNEEDLEVITDVAYNGVMRIFGNINDVNVKKIETAEGMRIRIFYNGFTVTMFDFITGFKGIKKDVIKTFIEEKNGEDFFFLSIKNEIIYRINKFLDNSNKQYHKDFIIDHKDMIKTEELITAFEEDRVEAVKELLSSI